MATTSQNQSALAIPHGAVHPIAPARLNKPAGRPETVPLGTWVWLASELMFFAALFAAYFFIRETTNGLAAPGQKTLWQTQSAHLDFPYAAVNTIILVLSSVTCQLGVFAAERGQVRRLGRLFQINTWGLREWFVLTFVMGAFFVGGQVYEYSGLVHEGLTIPANAYGSVFYIATGFHALHVTGGLLAFLFVLGRTFVMKRFTHEQATSAIVVSYYWHFVDVVWIALFTTIYLIK